MVLVEGGRVDIEGKSSDVRDFYLDSREVTNSQYMAWAQSHGKTQPFADNPAYPREYPIILYGTSPGTMRPLTAPPQETSACRPKRNGNAPSIQRATIRQHLRRPPAWSMSNRTSSPTPAPPGETSLEAEFSICWETFRNGRRTPPRLSRRSKWCAAEATTCPRPWHWSAWRWNRSQTCQKDTCGWDSAARPAQHRRLPAPTKRRPESDHGSFSSQPVHCCSVDVQKDPCYRSFRNRSTRGSRSSLQGRSAVLCGEGA